MISNQGGNILPDCTIAKQRFLFFCILHLCIYAFDEFLGLTPSVKIVLVLS